MATIPADLAERALLLAQDPVPADYAAAAELRRIAERADAPEAALLDAMTIAWDQLGDVTGELEWAGRTLLLLGMALDEPREPRDRH